MKKVMMAAAALAVLGAAASSAQAQDGQGRRDRDGQGARQDGGGYNPAVRRSWRNTPENVQAPAAPAPQAQAPQPPQAPAAREARRGDGDRDGRDRDRRDWDRRDGDRRDGNGRDWDGRDGRRDWNDRDRNWDGRRDWSDRRAVDRPRYDRRAYPWVHRTERRYQGPRYRPPSGFYARSWSYGQVLPRGWYGSDYRLNDWWSYGLPIPPAGYEWVRVGDDVLLVDIFTGRVVQVVYDLFW